MIHYSIESLIGNTPIVSIKGKPNIEANLYLKLEGYNISGSVKDRSALFLIKKVISNHSNDGKIILTGSSGSFATSLALIGMAFERKIHVVTTQKLTKEKLDFIGLFDAMVTPHGKFTIEAIRYCKDILLRNEPDKYVFIDQLHDWDASIAHYKVTGPEIFNAIPNISAIFFSIGSGATLYGVAKYLKERNSNIKVFAVTAEKGTLLPGTASFHDGDYKTPFIIKGYKDGLFDYTVETDYKGAVKGVASLRKEGHFVGLQSGGVFNAMVIACAYYQLKGDVLMLSGDSGWKNMISLRKALS